MADWSFEFSFDVDRKNHIIYEKIYGQWKKGTAQEYHDRFKIEVAPLIKKPWAKLVDLLNWKTSYPEVVALLGEHLVWCRENNMQLSINVIDNTSTFRQLSKMFSGGGTEGMSRTFRNRSQAEQFIREYWIREKRWTGKKNGATR
jgi:hypothetical protein